MGTILSLLITGFICVAIIAAFLLQSSAGDVRQNARVTGRGRAKSKPVFTPPPPAPLARRRLRWDQPLPQAAEAAGRAHHPDSRPHFHA